MNQEQDHIYMVNMDIKLVNLLFVILITFFPFLRCRRCHHSFHPTLCNTLAHDEAVYIAFFSRQNARMQKEIVRVFLFRKMKKNPIPFFANTKKRNCNNVFNNLTKNLATTQARKI